MRTSTREFKREFKRERERESSRERSRERESSRERERGQERESSRERERERREWRHWFASKEAGEILHRRVVGLVLLEDATTKDHGETRVVLPRLTKRAVEGDGDVFLAAVCQHSPQRIDQVHRVF